MAPARERQDEPHVSDEEHTMYDLLETRNLATILKKPGEGESPPKGAGRLNTACRCFVLVTDWADASEW